MSVFHSIENSRVFQLESSIHIFRKKALFWASKSEVCTYLYDHQIEYPEGGFKNLLAIGAHKVCPLNGEDTFEKIQQFHDRYQSWMFGHFTYDLKNELEDLSSNHTDRIQMPSAFFYIPEILLEFHEHEQTVKISVSQGDPEWVYQIIEAIQIAPKKDIPSLHIQQKISKEDYIQKVQKIQDHIIEGDVYEMNFCMEFYAEDALIDAFDVFEQLNEVSPTPFASFHKINDQFLLSASPERFIKKEGNRLISQPIKGTIRRGNTPQEDDQLKEQLRNDEKEIAENMMIVDLVRNDLARSCQSGTVKVPEIFGIYGFRQVFQMISTIEGQLKDQTPFMDALKYAFPMGSMTGAPKVMTMTLIEQYEETKRGLYSGSVGYITPEGDFDFNVIIRSILYNAKNKNLSYQIGSAITIDSTPEKEYDECLLKAKAIRKVLG